MCDVILAGLTAHVYADSVTRGACRRCGWQVADHLQAAAAAASSPKAAARGGGIGEKKRADILNFVQENPMKKKNIKVQAVCGCRAAFTGSDVFQMEERTDECPEGPAPALGVSRVMQVLNFRTLVASLVAEPAVAGAVTIRLDAIMKDCPVDLGRRDATEWMVTNAAMALGIEARTLVEEAKKNTRPATEIHVRNARGEWVDWRAAARLEEAQLRRATTVETITTGPLGIDEILSLPKSHPWRRDFIAGVAVGHRGFDTEMSLAGYWEDEEEIDVSVRAALKAKHLDDVSQWGKKRKETEQATLISKSANAARRSDGRGEATPVDDPPGQSKRQAKRAQSKEVTKEKAKKKKDDPHRGAPSGTPATPKGEAGAKRAEAQAILDGGGAAKDLPFWAAKALGRCATCGEEGHMQKECRT
jgi:hypothetical protein